MADQKDQKDAKKEDRARTHPYEQPEPRPQAEIVAQAYDHEDPTPTQAENDQAKLDAVFVPDGAGDPQKAKDAEAKKKKELEAAKPSGGAGYQTKAVPQKADI